MLTGWVGELQGGHTGRTGHSWKEDSTARLRRQEGEPPGFSTSKSPVLICRQVSSAKEKEAVGYMVESAPVSLSNLQGLL